MVFFFVDDGLHSHPKMAELSDAALGLWTRCGSWAARHGTDGFIPATMVRKLASSRSTTCRRIVLELVEKGVWSCCTGGRGEDGYQFHDWLDWQPSAEDVAARRKANAERQARYRSNHQGDGSNALRNGQRNGVSNDAHTSPIHTNPEEPPPSPPSTEDSAPRKRAGRKRPATRLPDDWIPNERHVRLAADRGVNGRDEEAKFRSHAEANDRRQADWDAAFRMWLLNAKPQRQPGSAVALAGGRSTASARSQQALDVANRLREQG